MPSHTRGTAPQSPHCLRRWWSDTGAWWSTNRPSERLRPTSESTHTGLFQFHGGVYLFAYVPVHRAVITLAVERIKSLTPTDEPFTVIKNFSFEAMRDRAFGVTTDEPMNVAVRFRKEEAPYVRERMWHPTQQLTQLRNGDLRLSFQAGGEIEIMRWVLSWGSAVTVLQPKALRLHVAEELRTASRLYSR